MKKFNNFIISNALNDLNLIWTTYTWKNNSSTLPQMSHIDKVLVTNQWDSIFPKIVVKALPHLISYHVTLLIDIEGD
ncbi:hypothetical protein AMTRI_Chr05g59830 [Amborella trichopoda]